MGKLQGVADTLFIPLEARIFASRKFPDYFYDEKALSLEHLIPDCGIRKNSSEYSFMASVARYYNMDAMVKVFIAKHGKCNVIYLGAGLETAYYRLGRKSAIFYEVDLPEVIAVRHSVLGEQTGEIFIGGDLFDLRWAEPVDKTLPSLLIVAGVFQYFTEEQVVRFIRDVGNTFGTAELIFDAANAAGLKYANNYVQKTGNTNALMRFSVNNGEEFAQKTGASLLEVRAFFTDARKRLSRRLGLYTRVAMKVVDDKRRAVILHLEISQGNL